MTPKQRLLLALAGSTLLLAACDLTTLLGGDEEAKYEAKREAEGKAVGSGCRYSARTLEDCYDRNPKMSKAYIFAGWRDMDGYMRENNIQAVPEQAEASPPPATTSDAGADKPKQAEAKPAEDKTKAAATEKPAAPSKTAETPKAGAIKQSLTQPPTAGTRGDRRVT